MNEVKLSVNTNYHTDICLGPTEEINSPSEHHAAETSTVLGGQTQEQAETSTIAPPQSPAHQSSVTPKEDTNDSHPNRRVIKASNGPDVEIANSSSKQDEFFSNIRKMCDKENVQVVQGPGPFTLAQHRLENWPEPTGLPSDLAYIYDKVQKSGIPNTLGVRNRLPTKLNLDEWHKVFGQYPEYAELLDFVEFGFPMGYLGPQSDYDRQYNHSSADEFPADIQRFIDKEISLGGIIGPRFIHGSTPPRSCQGPNATQKKGGLLQTLVSLRSALLTHISLKTQSGGRQGTIPFPQLLNSWKDLRTWVQAHTCQQ